MRIDTIPEGALLMYDNNQQSALGVKNCKVNTFGTGLALTNYGNIPKRIKNNENIEN
jgi:hypothetical protein